MASSACSIMNVTNKNLSSDEFFYSTSIMIWKGMKIATGTYLENLTHIAIEAGVWVVITTEALCGDLLSHWGTG